MHVISNWRKNNYKNEHSRPQVSFVPSWVQIRHSEGYTSQANLLDTFFYTSVACTGCAGITLTGNNSPPWRPWAFANSTLQNNSINSLRHRKDENSRKNYQMWKLLIVPSWVQIGHSEGHTGQANLLDNFFREKYLENCPSYRLCRNHIGP